MKKSSLRLIRSILLAGFMGMVGVSAGNATVVVGTFEGTITSGTDLDTYFGTPADGAAGEPLSGILTYDTDLAPAETSGHPGRYESSGFGQWLASSITINGVQWIFSTDNGSGIDNDMKIEVEDEPDSFFMQHHHTVDRTYGDGCAMLISNTTNCAFEGILFSLPEVGTDFITGHDLPENMTWLKDGQNQGSGSFSVNINCPAGSDSCTEQEFSGYFDLSRVELTAPLEEPAQVPEPGILGAFLTGLAGMAVFRRTVSRRARAG